MKLAIVGSASLAGLRNRMIAATIIEGWIYVYKPELIISGGATGVDALAEEAADSNGIPKSIHLPKNKRWQPDGFMERNLLIAQECTHLLRIARKDATTYGSGWTADRAAEMGKTVWQVYL